MPRKFKIGDVVRVKGDRKLARVKTVSSYQAIFLDRVIKGFFCWNPKDLVLVKAAPRRPVSGQVKLSRCACGRTATKVGVCPKCAVKIIKKVATKLRRRRT